MELLFFILRGFFLLGIFFSGRALYLVRNYNYEKADKSMTISCIFMIISLIIAIFGYGSNKENSFKTNYKIDLRENYYILYDDNKYDTIQHGKLEEYLIKDNE